MSIQLSGRKRIGTLIATFAVAGLCGCGQQGQVIDPELDAQQQTSSNYVAPRATPSNRVTVPSGTAIPITLSTAVGSETSQIGDHLTATTTAPIVIGNAVAIPVGSTIHGQVTDVYPAKKGLKISEKGGAVTLHFDKVTTPRGDSTNLSGNLTDSASSTGKTAGIIGGSTAGGALLGKVLGGSTKDAAIGAVLGGGIGTGIAAGTRGKELKIPAGTHLAIILDSPLSIIDRS